MKPGLGLVRRLPLWKQGVVRFDDFARFAISEESRHRGWWPFSFALLRELEHLVEERHGDEVVERVYRAILARPGVYKITGRGRFAGLDAAFGEFLARVWDRPELVVHDMGVSSGITSLELFQRLSVDFNVKLYASDYFDRLYVLQRAGSSWKFIFDAEQRPLQCVSNVFVLSANRPELYRFPVNRLMQAWVMRRLLPDAAKVLRQALALERLPADYGCWRIDQIRLYHPEVTRAASGSSRFILLRHSVFERNPVASDVVRLMNVLTPHHFTDQEVVQGLEQSARNLSPGGLLLIGRTTEQDPAETRASAYAVCGESLQPVWAINGGFEWPELVAQANLRRGMREGDENCAIRSWR